MSALPLHASALAALLDEMRLFSGTIRNRGLAYAADNRVGDVHVSDRRIAAEVRGTSLYLTTWERSLGGRWSSFCTCPMGAYCKHAYALGSVVLADARSAHASGNHARSSLPRVGPSAAAGRAAALTYREPASADLARLRAGRSDWERQSALDRLLVGAPGVGLSPYVPPLIDVLREPDPDLRCWRLAEAIAERAGGWVPGPLRAFHDRADLKARFVERERNALAAELLDWARRRTGGTRRNLRLVFDLDVQPDHTADLVFEARVTSPRLADVPRTLTQLQALRNESWRDGGMPPDQISLLDWLATHALPNGRVPGPPRFSTDLPLGLLERVAGSPLATWSDALDPAAVALGGLMPGGPVRLEATAVEIAPECVRAGGGVAIELCVRWPDGTHRGLGEVLYLHLPSAGSSRCPSLVASGGMLWPVGGLPPAALLERFRRTGALPLPPERRAEFVGVLAEHFGHLRQTLAAHSRIHPAALSVALDLRADDWLQVRLFALCGKIPWQPGAPVADGALLFEYGESGWRRRSAEGAAVPATGRLEAAGEAQASTAPEGSAAEAPVAGGEPELAPTEEVWMESPDPTVAAPLLDWLGEMPGGFGARGSASKGAGAEDGAVGWWMRVNPRTLDHIMTAWEKRPPGAAYFGTERLRRLLGRGRGVAPRLRVRASGVDWLGVSAEWVAEGERLTEADLARLRAASARFVKLECGWVRKEEGEDQEKLAAALADLGVDADGSEQRISVWQLAGAAPASLQALEESGADRETIAALDRLRKHVAAFTGVPRVRVPKGVTGVLRPYQRDGLDFLAHAAAAGLGAVLADDMGLGKTVQALAWLLHLRKREPDGGPALVVCPASVVHNWARESEHFTPALRVLLLTSGKTRHALREAIPEHDLVVTTYALLRRDIEAWRDVSLGAAILDEAQFIKNPDAAVSRAALELQARHRLALTGTPLENRALDLWSIMAFVNPGFLGSRRHFSARYDRPDAPPYLRGLLSAKLRSVLLRRTKLAVAPELPPRIEELRDCELTSAQRQLYLAELQRSRGIVAHIAGTPGALARNRITILAALTRLRQICCHPALAGGRGDLGSGKFEALFELLEPILAEGHKVLVFSQFVQALKLLIGELRLRGIPFHVLTGQTTRRQEVVDAFQADPNPGVFLISLKAGGTGLNLTAASYVVLFDPWWNPAVEAQAIDRSHRIGQDRTVIAYRLLTRGTIEEKIWELQQRKGALVRDVLGESGFARALTRDDLEFLLAGA